MRFMLLIIISTVCLQGCGDSKASPNRANTAGNLTVNGLAVDGLSVGDQLPTSVAPLEVVPSPSLGDEGFRYVTTQGLTAIDSGILKSRLETTISRELKALTENHAQIVFSDDVVPLENGGEADSGDISAFDGKYWFVGVSSRAIYTQQAGSGIDVWRVDAKSASPSHVGLIPFDVQPNYSAAVEALYLVKNNTSDQLVVRKTAIQTAPVFEKLSLPNPQNRGISFEWVDTATLVTEQRVQSTHRLGIDGQYLASTRVGDTLYVVSRYWAWIYGLNPDAPSEDTQSMFDYASTSDYLPKYRVNGSEGKTLSPNCYVGDSKVSSSPSLINITAINLKTHDVMDSQCVFGDVSHVFVSENSVFFGLDKPNVSIDGLDGLTELYQFRLDGKTVNYYGSGAVPGTATWGITDVGLKALDGGLYITSTQRDENWNPSHNVYGVRGFDGQLKFSKLSDEPFLVGNELLEARYADDQVYLIPKELGESTVIADLKPLLNSHSFRLMPPNRSNESSENSRRWIGLGSGLMLTVTNLKDEESWGNGLQLTLWDIKNSEVPVSLKTMTFEGLGTNSSSVFESKELDINKGKDGLIHITLPISIYRSDLSETQLPQWRQIEGVKLVVDTLRSIPSIEVVESIVLARPTVDKAESDTWAFRTLFANDHSLYYYNGQVHTGR